MGGRAGDHEKPAPAPVQVSALICNVVVEEAMTKQSLARHMGGEGLHEWLLGCLSSHRLDQCLQGLMLLMVAVDALAMVGVAPPLIALACFLGLLRPAMELSAASLPLLRLCLGQFEVWWLLANLASAAFAWYRLLGGARALGKVCVALAAGAVALSDATDPAALVGGIWPALGFSLVFLLGAALAHAGLLADADDAELSFGRTWVPDPWHDSARAAVWHLAEMAVARGLVLALFYARMAMQLTAFPDCFIVISGDVRVLRLSASSSSAAAAASREESGGGFQKAKAEQRLRGDSSKVFAVGDYTEPTRPLAISAPAVGALSKLVLSSY